MVVFAALSLGFFSGTDTEQEAMVFFCLSDAVKEMVTFHQLKATMSRCVGDDIGLEWVSASFGHIC